MIATDTLASQFKALGDPTRLVILEIVARGERCVCDLAAQIDIRQPLLSHHLRILRQAGFVTQRKEGRWSYYALNREPLEACQMLIGAALTAREEAARGDVPEPEC